MTTVPHNTPVVTPPPPLAALPAARPAGSHHPAGGRHRRHRHPAGGLHRPMDRRSSVTYGLLLLLLVRALPSGSAGRRSRRREPGDAAPRDAGAPAGTPLPVLTSSIGTGRLVVDRPPRHAGAPARRGRRLDRPTVGCELVRRPLRHGAGCVPHPRPVGARLANRSHRPLGRPDRRDALSASWPEDGSGPALRAELPPSWRRKTTCVVQGVALVTCLAPVVSPSLAWLVAAAALVTLTWSFWVDVRFLVRSRSVS